jgi:riboflavin biosynthesis pyrimidine reductase
MWSRSVITPLETLYEVERGSDIPLPPELLALYGRLQIPSPGGRSLVISNFVETIDGVVALNVPGHKGGGDISGRNKHDHMVMGLLRAIADAIIVGAGTLRDAPRHLWTAEYIYPPLAAAYQQLRISLDKSPTPLNVIVTSQGKINLHEPVFQSGKVPVLLVTSTSGEEHLRTQHLPPAVQLAAMPSSGLLHTRDILEAVYRACQCDVILVEGGPQLMGGFFAEHVLDELFLTFAPQVAGRDGSAERPGLVTGVRFAPGHPLWGTLISVKRAQNHLFLRYAFETVAQP